MNPGDLSEGYPCPCCGYRVFPDPPGSHATCPICLWEDDMAQLRFPQMPGGANQVCLQNAQHNYRQLGAAERRKAASARPPETGHRRDQEWRPLEPGRDNPEIPGRGVGYADSYPEGDPTVLYYWRSSYWRRLAS